MESFNQKNYFGHPSRAPMRVKNQEFWCFDLNNSSFSQFLVIFFAADWWISSSHSFVLESYWSTSLNHILLIQPSVFSIKWQDVPERVEVANCREIWNLDHILNLIFWPFFCIRRRKRFGTTRLIVVLLYN